MTKIQLLGVDATADGYVWQCKDTGILQLLNTLIDPSGPRGDDPDPDFSLAQAAVTMFRAKIVEHVAPQSLPGVVY